MSNSSTQARTNPLNTIAMHGALITYTLIALFPVFVILINSFKTRKKDLSRTIGPARCG